MAWDVPEGPEDHKRLLDDTRSLMLQWSMYPGHGGFFGYVSGTGTIPWSVVASCWVHCIVNFRSEADDIEALVDLAVRHGDELAGG